MTRIIREKTTSKNVVPVNSETFRLGGLNFHLDIFAVKDFFVCLFPPPSILFEFHLDGISKPLMFHGYKSLNNRALNCWLIPAHQIVRVPELNFIYFY